MMMRKFIVLAAMVAMVVVAAAPALAKDNDDRVFIVGGGVGQGFEQETESGDVDLSFESTNAGDNSNVAAPALQFANTGNLQDQQGFSSFDGSVDDVDFEGSELVFDPSLETDVDQAVQQSSAASSN